MEQLLNSDCFRHDDRGGARTRRGSRRPAGRHYRLLAVPRAALLLLLVGACSGGLPAGSPISTSSLGPGISIPTEELPPDTRCLIDHGFVLVAVLPPEIPGDAPGYKLASDLPPAERVRIIKECRKLAPEPEQPTVDELRVIYDRWVAERECLKRLGYQPVEPSSFEKFVSDYRAGPWMPIDGVDTSNWTDAEYRRAKEECTLEMFTRG